VQLASAPSEARYFVFLSLVSQVLAIFKNVLNPGEAWFLGAAGLGYYLFPSILTAFHLSLSSFSRLLP
jgi:hypothetical protein